jgi:anthranilate synthase component 1
MTEGYVRHVIAARVDPVVIFRALIAHRDGGFWLDDSLAETVSYLGVGARIETTDAFSGFDTADEFPVSRVGWIGYGARAESLGVEVGIEPQPRSTMLSVRLAVEVDHRDDEVSVIGLQRDAEFDELVSAIEALDAQFAPTPQRPPTRTAMWRDDPLTYAGYIDECLTHIRNGDAYQLCLTTGIDVYGEVDVVETYCALRTVAPTRNAAYLSIGGISLLSASPETYFTVRGRHATTSPIKGTRPRSMDPAEDYLAKRELETSEKERAENLMIVDLCRNDLSQVCEPGTVTVSSLHRVETYSTVHQLVSTVTGELLAECAASDAARALFPAGSMTGAPKRSAVQILERLESAERGMYAGAFGYAGAGNLTLAMTIRSIVIDGSGAHIGVGGGITSGSVLDQEIAEVGVKAAAMLGVLGASPNPYLYTE